MPAPAQTSSDVPEDPAPDDPAALAAFVARRAGRVLAYLEHVVPPGEAVRAAGDAFLGYRLARAEDPDADAPATALLKAVRRAAAEHAENPVRPEGRERSQTRTSACAVMPRLLIAWTESRLPEPDVERLVAHLHACPDCRAMRDAFDHAELGHRAGETVEPDRTAVAAIAAAMAGGADGSAEGTVVPADADGRTAGAPRPGRDADDDDELRSASPPTTLPPRRRRTAIPGPPSARGSATTRTAADVDRPSGSPADQRPAADPAPTRSSAVDGEPGRRRRVAGRRTEIPERPARRRTELPVRRDVPGPKADDAVASSAPSPAGDVDADGSAPSPRRARRTRRSDGDTPDDPLGPEALGYAVPRAGLPRAPRRPAVPRVRRRRPTRPPSPAVLAAADVEDGPATRPEPSGAPGPEAPDDGAATPTKTDVAKARAADAAATRREAAARRDRERETAERDAALAGTADAVGAPDREDDLAPATTGPGARATGDAGDGAADRSPARDEGPDRADGDAGSDRSPAGIVPATVTTATPAVTGAGGLAAAGRRLLAVPLVRQLGVPAVLLLVVLVAALVAAGVFAGQQEDTVAPVTRPTIPTVPADPNDIPPLR